MTVDQEDFARLLAVLDGSSDGVAALAELPAERCAAALGLDGVSVSLACPTSLELVWFDAADRRGTDWEDLQFTVGEGPSWDAAWEATAILEPDLRLVPQERWPALLGDPSGPPPVRAAVAIPLQLGEFSLGTLSGYRASPGLPDPLRIADTVLLAAAVTRALLTPAMAWRANGERRAAPLHRAVVHQAAGRLAAHHGDRIDQALDRLRAHAYLRGRPLLEVARQVVEDGVRLEDD
ncbi:ANTAR domain-containing protein [Phaeacidiphilus oryzae]|uniref:ANTAR domain-containing protein n=1 Tax=Phaeacidiphilus oryzae TaxID=348818 RepID=UPI00068C8404|nr:ANTAR domain-containing protein [Phaeacidiphilus oryzae]